MNILLDKKIVAQIIEKYYKEQLDFEGTAEITVEKEFGSYGYTDVEEAMINIKLKGNMMLLGQKIKTVITISTEEMKEAIKYCIEEEGYTFKGCTIEKGLNEKCIGYGPGEHTEKIPYFNGVNVNVDIKNKIKEIKKNENK